MAKDQKKIISWWLVGIFFVFILFYILFVSKDILFGVQLKNINIKNGETYTEKLLYISGNAKNAINVSLNNHEIAIDQKGNWGETVALSTGYNIITLEAKDKFGNNDKKTFRLIGGSTDSSANEAEEVEL